MAGFPDRLKRLRADADLSQIELAERVGVSVRQYQRWESGASMPGLGPQRKLAEALGVEVSAVAGDDSRTRLDAIERKLDRVLALLEER